MLVHYCHNRKILLLHWFMFIYQHEVIQQQNLFIVNRQEFQQSQLTVCRVEKSSHLTIWRGLFTAWSQILARRLYLTIGEPSRDWWFWMVHCKHMTRWLGTGKIEPDTLFTSGSPQASRPKNSLTNYWWEDHKKPDDQLVIVVVKAGNWKGPLDCTAMIHCY